VDEGILLGYGSNEHAYRVLNKTSGRVEVAVDVTFDESNGSQVEQVDSRVVGKEDPHVRQSSNWLSVTLEHKKIKTLRRGSSGCCCTNFC
jgi:hypothetical protein